MSKMTLKYILVSLFAIAVSACSKPSECPIKFTLLQPADYETATVWHSDYNSTLTTDGKIVPGSPNPGPENGPIRLYALLQLVGTGLKAKIEKHFAFYSAFRPTTSAASKISWQCLTVLQKNVPIFNATDAIWQEHIDFSTFQKEIDAYPAVYEYLNQAFKKNETDTSVINVVAIITANQTAVAPATNSTGRCTYTPTFDDMKKKLKETNTVVVPITTLQALPLWQKQANETDPSRVLPIGVPDLYSFQPMDLTKLIDHAIIQSVTALGPVSTTTTTTTTTMTKKTETSTTHPTLPPLTTRTKKPKVYTVGKSNSAVGPVLGAFGGLSIVGVVGAGAYYYYKKMGERTDIIDQAWESEQDRFLDGEDDDDDIAVMGPEV